MRLRDHLDDADNRALLPGMVEERLLALLHRAQVILGREVANACPLCPVASFRDLFCPRPIVGLGLQEPMRHRTPSSLLGLTVSVSGTLARRDREEPPVTGHTLQGVAPAVVEADA